MIAVARAAAAAALLLAAGAAPAAVPGPVQRAVDAALAPPGARAEVLELRGDLGAGCRLARGEVPRRIEASSRNAVHLVGEGDGRSCEAGAWARVRVVAPVLVTSRAVAAGEALADAVAREDRELLPGRAPLSAVPDGAVADRALAPGVALELWALRVGPRPGEPVTVVAHAGTLTVESAGRAIPCRRGRACALLPSGRRVEGDWHAGRIEVGLP